MAYTWDVDQIHDAENEEDLTGTPSNTANGPITATQMRTDKLTLTSALAEEHNFSTSGAHKDIHQISGKLRLNNNITGRIFYGTSDTEYTPRTSQERGPRDRIITFPEELPDANYTVLTSLESLGSFNKRIFYGGGQGDGTLIGTTWFPGMKNILTYYPRNNTTVSGAASDAAFEDDDRDSVGVTWAGDSNEGQPEATKTTLEAGKALMIELPLEAPVVTFSFAHKNGPAGAGQYVGTLNYVQIYHSHDDVTYYATKPDSVGPYASHKHNYDDAGGGLKENIRHYLSLRNVSNDSASWGTNWVSVGWDEADNSLTDQYDTPHGAAGEHAGAKGITAKYWAIWVFDISGGSTTTASITQVQIEVDNPSGHHLEHQIKIKDKDEKGFTMELATGDKYLGPPDGVYVSWMVVRGATS